MSNSCIITTSGEDKMLPKEDFKEIKFEDLPIKFRKDLEKDKKYITKSFVNSEGVWRVQIKNKPVKVDGLQATVSNMFDYKPGGFDTEDVKVSTEDTSTSTEETDAFMTVFPKEIKQPKNEDEVRDLMFDTLCKAVSYLEDRIAYFEKLMLGAPKKRVIRIKKRQ